MRGDDAEGAESAKATQKSQKETKKSLVFLCVLCVLSAPSAFGSRTRIHALSQSQLCSGYFYNHFNFHTNAQRDLRYAKGAAGVAAYVAAKNLYQQFAATVGY